MSGWEAFLALPWRIYPVLALGVAAVLLAARGVATFARSRRESGDPYRALLVARAFRTGILGLCVAVFAAAWLHGVGWLALLALIVVGEEMLETSVMIAVLEDGRARAAARAAPAAADPDALRQAGGWSRIDVTCPNRPSTSSSSAAAPAATSPPSVPRSSALRPPWSSARSSAASA